MPHAPDAEQASSKTLEGSSSRILGYLTGLGAVGAAVQGILAKLQDPGGRDQYLFGIVSVLLVSAWSLLRRRIGPRSRFKRPQELEIGTGQLLGRDGYLRDLLSVLRNHRLVFLGGRSGTGKSQLLAHGVLPALEEDPWIFPLLIFEWGNDRDWIEGPYELLASKLRESLNKLKESLDEETLQQLEIPRRVPAAEIFDYLDRLHEELGLLPVLLFDQFDDYIIRHQNHLRRGLGKIEFQELEAQNPFWREVAKRTRVGKIHCLFAARSDARSWLECFRFADPKERDVPRLEEEFAAALLDAVVEKAGLLDPGLGFTRLRTRLLQDLAPDGVVLPVQMKIAFTALKHLRPPVLAEYLRAGGLPGLEALFIERQVALAVEGDPRQAAEIRPLLVSMVDPVEEKTVFRSGDELAAELPPEKRDREKLDKTLRNLKANRLLRFQRTEEGHEVWQLDHDYLCRGVLALDRRARRWQLVLEEGSRTFGGAEGLLARWRALLTLTLQVRLLSERLRGKLTYGRNRGFAALSLLRLVANAWVVTAALGLFAWFSYALREEARDLFASEDLWAISRSPERVRRAVLDQIFDNEFSAKLFKERSEGLLFAIGGLDPARSTRLLEEGFRGHCAREALDITGMRAACLEIYKALAPDPMDAEIIQDASRLSGGKEPWMGYLREPTHPLLPEHRREAARLFLQELREPDPSKFDAERVAQLSKELTREEIGEAAGVVAMALGEKKRPDQVLDTCEALAHLGPWLPPWVGEAAAGPFLEVLHRPRGSLYLRRDLEGLVARIPEQKTVAIWNELVSILREDRKSISGAEALLPAVAARLPSKEADKAWDYIDHILSGGPAAPAYHVDELVEGRRPLAAKLSAEGALRSYSVLARAQGEPWLIASSLLDLRGKLPTAYQAEVQKTLVAWIQDDHLPAAEKLRLAGLLPRLGKDLSEPELNAIAWSLAGSLERVRWFSEMRDLLQALSLCEKNLSPKAAAQLAEAAADCILRRLPQELSSHSSFVVLAGGLELLAPRLSQPRIVQAINQLSAYYEHEPTSELRATLVRLGGRLSGLERRKLLRRFAPSPRDAASCGEAAPLFTRDDLDELVERMKWPTCTRKERALLLQRAGELTGKSFGRIGPDGVFQPDIRAFALWAGEQGYDLSTPPEEGR
ncbi:MAG TPA: ATP-binding protein [Thermoanaerobaculia bacterium]|nr:ATP-binding protein [Thermoanaerobaculia bacterium]